ncbi:MAG: hypothetical protein IKY91_02785, partial [Akkermansia sp.]|nr:hypothetical protein [Akkermansia sp.]
SRSNSEDKLYVTVDGTLVFDSIIDITAGGTVTECFTDVSGNEKTLKVGLAISSKSVTLSGDNKHSGGTSIDGVTVTLGHANALGTGTVTTKNTSGIKVNSNVTAKLPGTIINSGTLTLSASGSGASKGKFEASADDLKKVVQKEAYINWQGEESTTVDGFYRPESFKYCVVENQGSGTLNVSGTLTITIGATTYTLDPTGLVGDSVAPEYKTYYMTAQNAAVSDIQTTSNGSMELVKMSGAKLTVDADMEVESTGGEIAVAAGKTVSGTIENAKVSGTTGADVAAGIVDAALSGTNALTGKLTVTGAASGTLALDAADVTLTSEVSEALTLAAVAPAQTTDATGTTAQNVSKVTLTENVTSTLNLVGVDVTLGADTVLSGATVTTTGVTSLSTADEVTATLTKAITNKGRLTLSGSYDVSDMEGTPLPNNFIDVYGVEGTTGFAQYDRFEVEMVKKGADDAILVPEDADVEYKKKARATVGTLEGVLGIDGVASFVGGTDYSTYVIDNPNHQVSVSQIQDASIAASNNEHKTSKVVMSNGSLTADEDIVVQTTGGNLIVVDDGDDDKTDGSAVVSGTIKDTAVSAQGGTITATIEGGTLTTTGDALVSGDVTGSEITANGGEISGAISESTLDVSGDALVSGDVTDTEITAEGGEITGDVSESTLDVSGDALVRSAVTGSEITADGGELAGDISESTLAVSGDAQVSGAVTGSEITAKGGEILGDITGGTLMTEAGSQISGSVTDTAITTKGGEISGTIGGTSSLTAMSGMTTLSGSGNSYNGGTVVKDGATLVVTKNGGLGTGGVTVESGATLDMQTDGDAQIEGDLTVNDNGTITLNNGSLLVVDGSVTLNSGATIILNGEYDLNSALVSSTTGALTMNDVTLVYNGTTVELEMQNGQVVLVSKFKQDKANAATLSNWGIATAYRAVVNAVRGQRSNTGCIANGKGTAWVASLGSKHEINGSDIDISGAAVGADMKVGRNSRIGIALGYAEGEVQPAGFSQVDQEGSYLVVYGEHGLKKLSATSCLSMDWVAAYGTTDSEVGGL